MTSQKQIIFIGLPGSGKTSVGRLVAGRLGRTLAMPIKKFPARQVSASRRYLLLTARTILEI